MRYRKGITRRDFLKSTALATSAALVPRSLAQITSDGGNTAGPHRLVDGWEYYRGGLGGVWDVWRTDKNIAAYWQPVRMPHCFNTRDSVDPDEPYYTGPGWYRTRLKLANPFPDGRTLLHFEAAGQKSSVFIYLDKIGEHFGGYDEFVVDITDAASSALEDPNMKGEVPVAVLCDNSRDLDLSPSSLSDFIRVGGLYRPVNLVYAPAVSLERVHIDAVVRPGKRARGSVKARLYNPGALHDDLKIVVRIFSPAGHMIHSASPRIPVWDGMRELAAFDVREPELWSPADPSRYRCEVTLSSRHGAMTVGERFGFRHFEFVTHGPFKLNGERLLLRGTQRHHDHALIGAAMPDELIRKEMQMIKDMGANFIRLAHYQQSRSVLELCDELGLLVWEEIPWCRGGLGGASYQQHVREMLSAMIDQHYNHPSIILWSLGNEIDLPGDFPEYDKEKIRAFLTELNEQAHALDPSRKTCIRRCDFCKDIIDVYSPTLWAGWYQGKYTDYKDRSQKAMESVDHFLHAEWGGDSHARRHSEDPDSFLAKVVAGDTSDTKDPKGLDYLLTSGQDHAATAGDWSETYICNLFDWHLKEQETMPWLTGAAQWIFKDFATPVRPENPVPRVNQKGLVERDLTPKEGYYVFQSYWTEKPMVHIYGHSWPVRWGEAGEQKLVKVYSNCDTAELFLNRESQGSRKRESQNFPAAGLRWLVKFKSGENRLRVMASRNGRVITDEIIFQYQTEKWGKPEKLELRKKTATKETVALEARLLDSNGVFCLDARNVVRFGLAGNGRLLDNLGTSTGSRVLQLYNGRAEITLQTQGGKSVVSVSSAGLPTVFVTVE